MGFKLKNNWLFFMHHFCSGGACASPNTIRTEAEILNHLSHTACPHMCLPVILCNNGMLALADDKSRFMWGSWCERDELPRGFPSQRRTSMAITMLLASEMEHMGGNHVVILAAGVEPPPSCSAPPRGPAVNSESGWQAGSLHEQLSRHITCSPKF